MLEFTGGGILQHLFDPVSSGAFQVDGIGQIILNRLQRHGIGFLQSVYNISRLVHHKLPKFDDWQGTIWRAPVPRSRAFWVEALATGDLLTS